MRIETGGNQHLSIKDFRQDSDLSDFSVVIGTNGSGKTHLLKGLVEKENGFKLVDRDDYPLDCLYYHYSEFIADGNEGEMSFLKNTDEITRFDEFNNKIQEVIDNSKFVEEKGSVLNLPSNYRLRFLVLQVLSLLRAKYSNIISLTEKNELKNAMYTLFATVGNAHRPFWEGVCYVLDNEDAFDVFHECFSYVFGQIVNLEGFEFYKKRVQISEIDVLAKKIKSDFQDYKIKQQKFRLSLVKRKENGEEVDERKEISNFKKMYGIEPWKLLNSILQEYRCNDYFVSEDMPNPEPTVFQSEEEKEGAGLYDIGEIRVSDGLGSSFPIAGLSSGEKTLFALACEVYRNRRGGAMIDTLLLDEIDASLHPSMSEQFLRVLKKVFVEECGMKVILVTHDPSTVAHADDEDIFVLAREEGGHVLKKTPKTEALDILTDGIVTLDDILKIDEFANCDAVILSEGMNYEYLEKARELLFSDLSVKAVGLKKSCGSGDVRALFNFLRILNTSKKIFYVWDCDYRFNEKGN